MSTIKKDNNPLPPFNKGDTNFFNLYAIFLYVFACILTSVTVFLGYNIFTKLDLYEQFLFSFFTLMILFTIAFFIRDTIAEMLSRLTAEEKVGLSIVFLLIFFLPSIFFKTRVIAINVIFLIYLLSLLLHNEKSFCRLYFADMFLMFLILLTRPRHSFLLLLMFFGFLSITFVLDYFRFKFEKYGDRGDVFIEHPLIEGILIFVFSLFLFLPIYFIIPVFKPAMIENIPKKSFDEVIQGVRFNQILSTKDVLIIILLIILIFIGMKALQWFLLHRKSGESFENVVITETGAVYRRKREKPKKPKWKVKSMKDKVIYLYNNLCYDMTLAGFERKRFFTPNDYLNEYEKEIKEEGEKFGKITRIFEKARYSQENVLINEVEEIKSLYKSIKNKVKDVMYLKLLVEGKKSFKV